MEYEYAWFVVRKKSKRIMTLAGIEFESVSGTCPERIKINPIYSEEYENVRLGIPRTQ